MKSHVQLLGAGALDSGAFSLLLFFDEHRYLFNCSEGTQRAAVIDAVRISRVDTVFLTSLCWSRIGGLPGFLCTLRDMREEAEGAETDKLLLVGPEGTERILHATRPFVHRSRFPVDVIECNRIDELWEWSDGTVTANAVWIDPSRHGAKRLRGPRATLAYLVKGPRIPGKFDVAKARSLGLLPGPDYGKLIRGESVTTKDGAVINPSDCVGESIDHPALVIADLPSPEHESSFLSVAEKWLESDRELVLVVFLLTEKSISDDNQQYSNLFPKAEIIRIASNNQFTNREFHDLQASLSAIHPGYRLPQFERSSGQTPFSKVHLYPSFKMEPFTLHYPESFPEPYGLSSNNTIISFLGTAAAIPGKYRNVSGILITQGDGRSVMMDCGEGSLGQLQRLVGDGVSSVIDNLSAICLTHIHADHHLGLFSILSRRSSSLPPLSVFAPERFRPWLEAYEAASDACLNFRFVSCSGEQAIPLGTARIESISALHCPDSYGFLLTDTNTSDVIVYSGDTLPSPRLVGRAKGATVLIHEATMPDDLPEEAALRCHCTVSQAVNIAVQSECKHCILTHLSQRFAKSFPVINGHGNVSFAGDLLSVTLADLPSLASKRTLLPPPKDTD